MSGKCDIICGSGMIHMGSRIYYFTPYSVLFSGAEAHLLSFWKFIGGISLTVKLLGGEAALLGRYQEF